MLENRLIELIRPEVRRQQGYVAEIPTSPVRLDANESPFPLPPSLKDTLKAYLSEVSLNRYPEPGAPSLLAGFAEHYGVERDMIIAGNGSDELIQILCTSIVKTRVLVPVPTFVMYRITAVNNGHRVSEIPLDDAFDLDLPAMLKTAAVHPPGIVFLSYPNNPTGNCYSREKIMTLLTETSWLVVVDEAYGSFSGQSFVPFLKERENLLVLKTLSKIGFAAARIGFLLGSAAFIRELNKVRLPYNVNALSQAAARFYLDHQPVFSDQVTRIVENRERLFKALGCVEGVRPYRSDANFIFFRCLFDVDRIYTSLRHRGVLVRNFGTAAAEARNCLRVTVGTEEENDAFLEALKESIHKLGA